MAGGDTTLSLLLMLITNVLGIFIVPPLLMVMTDLNDSVPFKDLGFLVVCMFLTVHLPTIVSITLLKARCTGRKRRMLQAKPSKEDGMRMLCCAVFFF